MAYVRTCTDFDSETQTCFAEGWVQVSTWVDYLPTVEQATQIGGLMLLGVMSVMAMGLLIPPSERDSD